MRRAGFLFALPLALATAAVAQTPTTTAPVIVSATRTAQTVDQSLASVSVISRTDIERLQANSVQDLLRGLPGITISNNGGRGRATSVFLRGAESDQVLVLIDGVKVGSASLGTYAFQDLPVEQIERIEVVRGPRASLYGSEAIGGVIQIFTRRGGGKLRPFARVTVGERNTFETGFGVSGGGEQGWFNVTGTRLTTRGINSCDGTLTAGCFTVEPDRDGYQNKSASVRAGYRFDSGVEVDGFILRTSADVEYDGAFQNESDNRQALYGGKMRYSPMSFWDVNLSAGHTRDESKNYKDSTFASKFITRRESLSLQNDFQLNDALLLTVGGDYQRDRVGGSTDYAVRSRRNKAVFAQLQASYDEVDVLLAGRHDDNDQFDTANTGNAAFGWQVTPLVRLVASWGRAFKAPTFNELYFPFFGNPNLRPEESHTVELGLNGNLGPVTWGVNIFQSKVDDLISFDATTFAPANIGKARINGIELSVAGRLLETDLSASFTGLDPRNRGAGANLDKLLPRRPKHSLRVDVDRSIGDFAVGGTLLAEGYRYDDLANTRRLGGFGTVDLRARYNFYKAWTLQARIENLLDKSYETAAYFNQPGRSAFVTLRYEP